MSPVISTIKQISCPDGKLIISGLRQEVRGGIFYKGTLGNIMEQWNVLYLIAGSAYTSTYICQRSSNCTCNWIHFTICKRYSIKFTFKEFLGNEPIKRYGFICRVFPIIQKKRTFSRARASVVSLLRKLAQQPKVILKLRCKLSIYPHSGVPPVEWAKRREL